VGGVGFESVLVASFSYIKRDRLFRCRPRPTNASFPCPILRAWAVSGVGVGRASLVFCVAPVASRISDLPACPSGKGSGGRRNGPSRVGLGKGWRAL